ncbi:MAG TPA: hypothetical protein VGF97_11350 [Rhizomicrobium sp.]|jgi:hypothetical protein
MLTRLAIGLFLLAASAGGAAAEQMCGDPPIPPAIPTASEMASKPAADAAASKHSAFEEIRRWQGTLKSYRDCQIATGDTDKREISEAQRASKPDPDKIKKLQQEIDDANHAYDSSVDEEERTVNEFHAASVAYCARSDVDRTNCPKS